MLSFVNRRIQSRIHTAAFAILAAGALGLPSTAHAQRLPEGYFVRGGYLYYNGDQPRAASPRDYRYDEQRRDYERRLQDYYRRLDEYNRRRSRVHIDNHVIDNDKRAAPEQADDDTDSKPARSLRSSRRKKHADTDADSIGLAATKSRETRLSSQKPQGTLQIVVSIAKQNVALFADGVEVAHSRVSTGMKGHLTPLGIFNVIQKQKWHESNIYSGAPMPFMQRITWSGIALHAGVLPGHPASHGCIRVSDSFARYLWAATKIGARFVVARDELAPAPFSNPHLFVPKKPVTPPVASPETAPVASGSDPAATDHPAEIKGVETAMADHVVAQDTPAVGILPVIAPNASKSRISVFISRKDSKLYVRQDFAPLFDVPVTIRDPQVALGTHLFTVVRLPAEGGPAQWTVMTIPERAEASNDHRKAKLQRAAERPAAPSTDAAAALERIDIPQAAADRIGELLTAGSSLIVSDSGINNGETGKETDFIVLTR